MFEREKCESRLPEGERMNEKTLGGASPTPIETLNSKANTHAQGIGANICRGDTVIVAYLH